MDYERASKSSAFAFGGVSGVSGIGGGPMAGSEPSRMFKNAYASQFHKTHVYSSNNENFYPNYTNNNNNNSGSQFHHQRGASSISNFNGNNNTNNALINISNNFYTPRQRFTPYYNKRSYANATMHSQPQSNSNLALVTGNATKNTSPTDANNNNINGLDSPSCVTLQISNLDSSFDEHALKQQLINKLKPITSVISIYFEAISVAKIKLPSAQHAKQVISFLHRKKIGHKRITVSYIRDSSSTEPSTLRCQVVGILKDIPNYKLSMFKFREIFQSRFKTSISVMDLYEMKDICTIIENKNEDKYITLRAELIDSIENSDLVECLQHTVPYCTNHFVKSHRGWAEHEIDPLPNVMMNVPHVRTVIYELLRSHKGDIPIASIVHCIQSELHMMLERNENGVNFEHLITCVSGIQIASNKFGIKILSWLNADMAIGKDQPHSDESSMLAITSTNNNSVVATNSSASNRYSKYGNIPDSFNQVSREIVELIKISPKSTLKFSRFIPAYHNHFGKQCRVADYGYTKLIDLFEALVSVVQVMGEGENRLITLTHKMQVRRFTSDLLRVLRTQSTKSVLLSQLALAFEQVQAKKFDITDYGVCDVKDILDGLVHSNVVMMTNMPHIMDVMIAIPKRKQSTIEVEKTSVFAGEVVELLKHSSQYTILFEKFACSYHYHFGYQCRLCDYGFVKLADLMEAITGLVQMESSSDEDRKIFLSLKVAQRIFSEQLNMLADKHCGSREKIINLHEVLVYHKKTFGYQITPQTLGFEDMLDCIKSLPYIELITTSGYLYVKCHHDDMAFRQQSYAACRLLLELNQESMPLGDFVQRFAEKFTKTLSERMVDSMRHAIEIRYVNGVKCVSMTKMMRFVVHLIGVIETQGSMKMQQLQSILNLPINCCFAFGYPNICSVMQAFPDIFVSTTGKPIDLRGEVKLNGQCILTTTGFITFMQYTCDDNNNNINISSSGQLDKTPETNSNTSSSAYDSGSSSMLSLSSSSYTDLLPSTSTYDNMLNNSQNIGGALMANAMDTSLSMQMEKPIQTFEAANLNWSYSGAKIDDCSSSIGRGQNVAKIEENAMHRIFDGREQTINRKRLSNNYFDPPKPDTPPSSSQQKKVPFWLDPIWSLDQNSPKLDTVNVKIPELHVPNNLPILNTPLAMASLAKTSIFAFDK